jgi:hypothetical protein
MRRRFEPHTFEQRLDAERLRLERELKKASDGQQRDMIAARIEQLQAAGEMYEFLSPRD